jgi:DNA-binding transcriptional MerR regulator
MKKTELAELVGYHVDDIYPRLSRRGKVVVKGFKRYLVDTNKKIFEAAAQRASKDKVQGTYYPLVPETIREIMQHVGKDVESVSRKDPKSKYHIFSLFVIWDSLYCMGCFEASYLEEEEQKRIQGQLEGWLKGIEEIVEMHPELPEDTSSLEAYQKSLKDIRTALDDSDTEAVIKASEELEKKLEEWAQRIDEEGREGWK